MALRNFSASLIPFAFLTISVLDVKDKKRHHAVDVLDIPWEWCDRVILEGKNDSARMAYKIADGGVFQFMTTNHSQEKDETVGFAKK